LWDTVPETQIGKPALELHFGGQLPCFVDLAQFLEFAGWIADIWNSTLNISEAFT